MTITLDYRDLEDEDERAVLEGDVYDFEFELLAAELVFCVGAADLSFHEYTPLLDAAGGLRGALDRLPDGETREYRSPTSSETIRFTRGGEQVSISASYTDATATASLSELREAAREFHERVTRDLLELYPGLDENADARAYLALDA